MSNDSCKRIYLKNGSLSYREAGSGPVIFFLHGLGGGSKSWCKQMEILKDRFTTISWDAPGYGSSDRRTPDLDSYSEAAFELIKEMNLSEITLVGHSMGGLISGKLSAEHPEYFSRLVLSSTFAGEPKPADAPLNESFKQRLNDLNRMEPAEFGKIRAGSVTGKKVDPEALDIISEIAGMVDKDGGYEDACNMLNRADNTDNLPRIHMPVLILEGEEDTIVSKTKGDVLQQLIPHSERKIIHGAGHSGYLEKPEEYAKILINFISEN